MAPSSSVVAKIKVQLKLAIARLRMIQQKDTAVAKQQRRAMAQLLEQGKEESARIRVENIIRSDITTELHEILELYCELLLARTGLMEAKECDPGLEEAIKSVIHAAPRTDIKELHASRALLVEKYGKDFAMDAMDNKDNKVAERVVKRLRVDPPAPELVNLYLIEIARTYGVAWPKGQEPAADESVDEGDSPSGGQAVALEDPLTTSELAKATPPRDLGPRSPVSVAPPSPSVDNPSPKVRLPGPSLPGPPELKPSAKMSGLGKKSSATSTQDNDRPNGNAKSGPGGTIPEVDDLQKRFAALKR